MRRDRRLPSSRLCDISPSLDDSSRIDNQHDAFARHAPSSQLGEFHAFASLPSCDASSLRSLAGVVDRCSGRAIVWLDAAMMKLQDCYCSILIVRLIATHRMILPVLRFIAFGNFCELSWTDESVDIHQQGGAWNHSDHQVEVHHVFELHPGEAWWLHVHHLWAVWAHADS